MNAILEEVYPYEATGFNFINEVLEDFYEEDRKIHMGLWFCCQGGYSGTVWPFILFNSPKDELIYRISCLAVGFGVLSLALLVFGFHSLGVAKANLTGILKSE